MANSPSASFQATLENNGYLIPSENLLHQMISICSNAQRSRVLSSSSTESTITRSTALVALNYLNPNISQALIQAGFDWNSFASSLHTGNLQQAIDSTDLHIHADLENALIDAPQTLSIELHATPEAIAIIIINNGIQNPSQGQLGRRLKKFQFNSSSADLASLYEQMIPIASANEANAILKTFNFTNDDIATKLSYPGVGGRVIQALSDVQLAAGASPGDRVAFLISDALNENNGALVGYGYIIAPLWTATSSEVELSQTENDSFLVVHIEELFLDKPISAISSLSDFTTDNNLAKPVRLLNSEESTAISELLLQGHTESSELHVSNATPLSSELLDDNPELVEDLLNRGTLAVVTARILHRVWMRSNHISKLPKTASSASDKEAQPRSLELTNNMNNEASENLNENQNKNQNQNQKETFSLLLFLQTLLINFHEFSVELYLSVKGAIQIHTRRRQKTASSDAAFIFHLDAPWGGGKTTFSNYLSFILNPVNQEGDAPSFLGSMASSRSKPFPYFITDPPIGNADSTQATLSEVNIEANTIQTDLSHFPIEARRAWMVVRFNAWKAQHVNPPWWNFYQSFREQCFEQLLSEGNGEFTTSGNLVEQRKESSRIRRKSLLWLERLWLLGSPKARRLWGLSIACLSIFFILKLFGLDQANGLMTTLLTGSLVSALWSVGTVVTESVVPSNDSFSERLNLGEGDPLKRFSTHFSELCSSLERPIIVLIDDLDRCDENYITGLMHGLQTILRSPKVVYVLIGDKNWIEKAFNTAYGDKESSKASEESVTIGAKFVEKAIQLSLLLPKPRTEDHKKYIASLLGVDTDNKSDQLDKKIQLKIKSAVQNSSIDDVVELKRVGIEAAASTQDTSNTDPVIDISEKIELAAAQEAVKKMSEENGTETRIAHALQNMQDVLPTNPRQIKRLINSITIYLLTGVAHGYFPAGNIEHGTRWKQLVMWIVLCTEQPYISRILAGRPWLTDAIHLANAGDTNKLKALLKNNIPSKSALKNAEQWVEQTQRNAKIYKILSTSSEESNTQVQLDEATVIKLLELTPLSPAAIPIVKSNFDENVDVETPMNNINIIEA